MQAACTIMGFWTGGSLGGCTAPYPGCIPRASPQAQGESRGTSAQHGFPLLVAKKHFLAVLFAFKRDNVSFLALSL